MQAIVFLFLNICLACVLQTSFQHKFFSWSSMEIIYALTLKLMGGMGENKYVSGRERKHLPILTSANYMEAWKYLLSL